MKDAAHKAAFVVSAGEALGYSGDGPDERGELMSDPLPVLRCESRRPPPFERGLMAWSLALVLLGAAALDAFWAGPAQTHRRYPATPLRVVQPRCPHAAAAARPPARKVEDVHLLTPTQAAR